MPGPVALPGLNDANPVRQNTAIRQISERLEADYAPLDSPVFTGDPTAPTPDLTDNDTSIATTAYVQGQSYTTKTYVDAANATQDTAIAGKAALVHTHAQSDVTGLVSALAGKEPTIAAGTTSQYWRGDKTWQAFPSQKLVGVYAANYTSQAGLTTTFTATTGTPGTQIISLSVTTTTATQVIDILFVGYASCTQTFNVGLFIDGNCVSVTRGASTLGSASILYRHSPGAAGTYTLTVRAGPNAAATLNFNQAFTTAVAATALQAYVVEP